MKQPFIYLILIGKEGQTPGYHVSMPGVWPSLMAFDKDGEPLPHNAESDTPELVKYTVPMGGTLYDTVKVVNASPFIERALASECFAKNTPRIREIINDMVKKGKSVPQIWQAVKDANGLFVDKATPADDDAEDSAVLDIEPPPETAFLSNDAVDVEFEAEETDTPRPNQG